VIREFDCTDALIVLLIPTIVGALDSSNPGCLWHGGVYLF